MAGNRKQLGVRKDGGSSAITSVNGDVGVVTLDLQSVTDIGGTTTNAIVFTGLNKVNTFNDDGVTIVNTGSAEAVGLRQDRVFLNFGVGDISIYPNTNTVSAINLTLPSVAGTMALLSDIITGAITQQTHNATDATGATVTIADNTTILYVNPASAIANLTITMPANPINGQEVKVSFGGSILTGAVATVLSIVGNTGHAVLAGESITTANAGIGYTFKFQSSLNLWRIF